MPCQPACMKTTSLDVMGNLIMISSAGNLLYPIEHTAHPRCQSCIDEEKAQILNEIAKLKAAIGRQGLHHPG